jgi:hypothetical protein
MKSNQLLNISNCNGLMKTDSKYVDVDMVSFIREHAFAPVLQR